MATRRVLLLLGFAIVAMMTAAAATESVKVLTNAADKVAEASARSAVGGDPLVKVSTRTVGEDEGANTASSLALASLSSKAATAGSHLVKVTSGVDVLMETASRMDTDVARPMTSSAAAATAEATDKGNPSLVGTASSRKVTASSVDAVIRSVSASSNRDAVIKVTRALALAFLGERQLQFQYHVVMIRNTLWHNAKFSEVIYSDVWTFRRTPFKIFIFRTGTLLHTPASLASFGYYSRNSKQTSGKVEFYRLS